MRDGICTQCLIEHCQEISAVRQNAGSDTLFLCEDHADRAKRQERTTQDLLSLIVSVLSILAALILSICVGNLGGTFLISVVIGGCIATCVWMLKFQRRVKF